MFFEVFPIFSLFFELRRLWDHSQIVDLIFLNRMVSTRASESSKTPHSWQNNVQKMTENVPRSIFKAFLLFFIISWALEALGPLPNCRSHFCDSNKQKSKIVLGCFGTLFCHEWRVLEVSEALDDTGLSGKMRSTIWEWSQNLRSSKNKEKIRNTSKKLDKKLTFFLGSIVTKPQGISVGVLNKCWALLYRYLSSSTCILLS